MSHDETNLHQLKEATEFVKRSKKAKKDEKKKDKRNILGLND